MRLNELKTMLLSRDYRSQSIDTAFEKIRSIERFDALKRVHKEKNDRTTFCLTYYPQLFSTAEILHRHWRSLTSDSLMKDIYPNPPMVAFKQTPNLGCLLTRARLPPVIQNSRPQRINHGTYKCNRSNCSIDPYIKEGNQVKSFNSNEMTVLQQRLTCVSTFVIYCISCQKCGKQYIGETKRALYIRVREHLGYINKNIEATGQHFNLPGHSKSDLRVQIIEAVFPKEKSMLQIRERLHINNFKSRYPGGMNKE